jgi:predicted Mrr-cat superfamily restriction endonuclease
MSKVWMVRAGRAAIYASDFISQGITAIGWGQIGNLDGVRTRERISELISASFSDYNRRQPQRY